MNFAIMRLQKINSLNSMHAADRHFDDRSKLKNRTHPELEKNNKCFTFGHDKSLVKAFENASKRVNKTIRKDAVRCIEFVLTYSPEAEGTFNKNDWVKKNYEWLIAQFGSENIAKMRIEYDEKTPHIHAFVFPITKDGRLSAADYINGKKALSRLQTSYSKSMEEFGLERGNNYQENPGRCTRKHRKCRDYWYEEAKAREASYAIFKDDYAERIF